MNRSPLLTRLRVGPDGSLLSRSFHAVPSASDVASKWQRNLANSTQDIQAGVDRVTEAPGAAAAAALQKWLNKLQDPAVQQKWARNVGAVSLQSWKDSMKNYGINRVAQGAQAKQGKFEAIMRQLLPYVDQGKSAIAGMPSTTYQDREQRMLAWSRYMRDFQRSS